MARTAEPRQMINDAKSGWQPVFDAGLDVTPKEQSQ
jgi:hypothetical protein